jgi:hypothetical protein
MNGENAANDYHRVGEEIGSVSISIAAVET